MQRFRKYIVQHARSCIPLCICKSIFCNLLSSYRFLYIPFSCGTFISYEVSLVNFPKSFLFHVLLLVLFIGSLRPCLLPFLNEISTFYLFYNPLFFPFIYFFNFLTFSQKWSDHFNLYLVLFPTLFLSSLPLFLAFLYFL